MSQMLKLKIIAKNESSWSDKTTILILFQVLWELYSPIGLKDLKVYHGIRNTGHFTITVQI